MGVKVYFKFSPMRCSSFRTPRVGREGAMAEWYAIATWN